MTLILWKDKQNKILDPRLFSTEAEDFARQMHEEAQKERKDINKSSQLRKFFDEILRLNQQAQTQEDNWNMILPQVHMVIAKTAYAKGRNLISQGFVKHIREGIEQIETKEDLQIFASHLEAFIGFYKIYNNK